MRVEKPMNWGRFCHWKWVLLMQHLSWLEDHLNCTRGHGSQYLAVQDHLHWGLRFREAAKQFKTDFRYGKMKSPVVNEHKDCRRDYKWHFSIQSIPLFSIGGWSDSECRKIRHFSFINESATGGKKNIASHRDCHPVDSTRCAINQFPSFHRN